MAEEKEISFLHRIKTIHPTKVLQWITALGLLLFFILRLQYLPFFGDHVTLGSAPANYIYDHDFRSLILPSGTDTGHPPLFPLILAGVWKVFGRTVPVSHWFFLLLYVILLVELRSIAIRFIPKGPLPALFVLFFSFPVLLAQTVSMSVDVLLADIFFLGLLAVFRKKEGWLFIACALLPLLSLRGIMLCGMLGIFTLTAARPGLRRIFRLVLFYGAAMLPFICWEWFHYRQTGWLLSDPRSPWSAGRAFVGAGGFLPKAAEYGFRYTESGMLLPWAVLIIAFCIKKYRGALPGLPLFRLILIGVLFFACFLLPFQNPVIIRYLLVIQLLVLIIFVHLLSIFPRRTRNVLFACTLGLFIAAEFFVYPDVHGKRIAYNWGDGSLAHLPYFTFQAETRAYIDSAHIDPAMVYAVFPAYKSLHDTDLKSSDFQFGKFEASDTAAYRFVICSNISNLVSVPLADALESRWTVLLAFHSPTVQYYLLENPRYAAEQ